ncbi:hypothetical protein O181_051368 [Austropuccinia psidii MF-1]|uniref:Uncharacterized protein n=1 Tax=Austropuccinia psidii MF-1 TaxID=1389203 RepID=A0A9Q3E0U6_9BASI|nr:hypothetical protein [Austropuccinia psidii MF-1]
MMDRIKSKVVIFFLIFHLQHNVYSPFPGVWLGLGRGANDGRAVTGTGHAAIDLSNAGKKGKESTAFKNIHVDPARAGVGGLPERTRLAGGAEGPLPKHLDGSSNTRLPSIANEIKHANPAAAMETASRSGKLSERFSRAMNYLAEFVPNLYRRVKMLIFGLTPADVMRIGGFRKEFEAGADWKKAELIINTFESFTARRVVRSRKELLSWVQTIGEVMNVANKGTIKSTLVETQLQRELGNLLFVGARDGTDTPLRQTLREFQNLHVELYERALENRNVFLIDKSYEKIKWGRELMNVDEDLLKTPEIEAAIKGKLENSALIEPFLKEMEQLEGSGHILEERVESILRRMLGIIADEKFGWIEHPLARKPNVLSNTYSIEDRTAAATGVAYLFQTSLRAYEADMANKKAFAFIMALQNTFFSRHPVDYFYPHLMKLRDNTKFIIPNYHPQLARQAWKKAGKKKINTG